MEEKNSANFAVANILDLGKFSTKTQFNVAIDSNAHINRILNIQTFAYDINTESQEGRVTIGGKVAVKVLYQDVDGIFNTLTDNVAFSEVISNSAITSNCKIVVSNVQCSNSAEFDEKFLKVSCFIIGGAFCCFNLGLSCMQEEVEGLIVKRNNVEIMDVVQNVQAQFSLENEIDLKETANKILVYCTKVFAKDFIPYDGYAVVDGDVEISLIYEIESDGRNQLKLFKETFPFRKEIEVALCDKDSMLDLEAMINQSKTVMNVKFDDNSTKINFENFVDVGGFCYKISSVEMACDAYSTENELTLNNAERNINFKLPLFCFKEDVNLEMPLEETENSIDEILGMTNVETSITNYQITNGEAVVEGLFSTTLLYLDENKQIASMNIELPLNLTHALEENCNPKVIHFTSSSSNVKVKLKRGSVLDIDFELQVCASFYVEENIDVLQSVKFGKAIDHGDIAFQIFIAKENEEMWDLCKRIRISPENLTKSNKDLNFPCHGGEKIVIYR